MLRALLGVSVGWLGISMVADGLPALLIPYQLLVAGRETSATTLGLLTLIAIALAAAAQPLAGHWSDRVGRLPVMVTLSALTADDLVRVLTEPKNALVKQYQRLFSMEGTELEIRPGALNAIARKALKRKAGARGLRSILEQVLLDTMYELPSLSGAEKVVIEENAINGEGKPLVIYGEKPKVAGSK